MTDFSGFFFLNLASFFLFQMASSGIPGVTMDAVSYIQRALMPDLSSAEAAATFSRLIEESLNVISFLIGIKVQKFLDLPS